MIAIIIASHGLFSEELFKSSEMIFGKQTNVNTVTFLPGEGISDLTTKYMNSIKSLNSEDGVLFIVDIFGGSPFNCASILALENENIEVITGANLPMLLEVFANKSSLSLKELLTLAENSGKESIKKLIKSRNSNLEEDEL